MQYADEIGFDYVYAAEHHCLEEFSHCSTPEILFAAARQCTSRIRIAMAPCCFLKPIIIRFA
ncbi:MAG: LLM class flavin-dependent oxidoreductase [Deltaproteobacteria bacterium]|nr:LLM class flavin-dependent oxidoreductase [Deltaproteobacteria bacterium]